MLFFDPMYLVLVMLPGLLISGAASLMVRSAFSRYSRVGSMRNITGAQAAQAMLDHAGIHDVTIVPTQGFLSDHYNPTNKTLALSPDVYQSTSVAAIGVACHEAGHALQHAHGYVPLWLRSALVPAASLGSNLGYLVMIVGFFLTSQTTILIGAALFSLVVLFQIVTLPVEFDASARAKREVVAQGILYPEEQVGVNRVLNAAAMTYVAAAVSSILTLLYYLMRAGVFGSSDD
jgi:Zn-dependent membrane protease YugP